jgi:hypothetical protein
MEYHIDLHIKVSKMKKMRQWFKLNIKMTSMYNKLWKKQDECFYSSRWKVIFARMTKIYQIKKTYKPLVSSINCAYSITIVSSSIPFKLQ